ncbi:MAG: ZIP family metal transporter [Bacteroidales bacterium]
METSIILPALLMTIFEGAALLLGLLFTTSKRFGKGSIVPFLFAFSGGMMLYAAFLKFMPGAIEKLNYAYTPSQALLYVSIAFFIGLLVSAPIDHILTKRQKQIPCLSSECEQKKSEHHVYILLLLSITLHNFLEGIATYFTYIDDPDIALIIVASLIAHNIPEGAIISMLVYKHTESRRKAVRMCLLSGLAGPAGAILMAVLMPAFLTPVLIGIVKALLAGLLVNTALAELILPSSYLYNKHIVSKRGIVTGMMFMAFLLIISQ